MKRRYIAWMLAGVMLLSTVLTSGCAKKQETETGGSKVVEVTPMEKEESYAVSFNFIGGNDVMPIGGFYGPSLYNFCWDGNQLPDAFSDEMMELIVESGVNLITHSGILTQKTMDVVYKQLEQAEKYGIGVFSIDAAVVRRGESALSATQVAERIAKQMKYRSYCGIYFVDEPATPYFYAEFNNKYISELGDLADVLHNQLGLMTYGNLFPMGSVSNKEIYEKYVDEYLETINPPYLMWDEYPFNEIYGGDMQAYIVAMSILCKKAKENKLPFWTSIQAGDQWGKGAADSKTPYWPNEAQFDWNINTGLAYGAQGLQYYTLLGVASDLMDGEGGLDPYRASIVGVVGNKTQWFYYAQNINKHIAAMDHVLMNSVHKGVIIKGEQIHKDFRGAYEVLEGETFQELQSIAGDEVMVGCFNYNGKTALYVVNYSMEYADHITLNFNTEHNITVTQAAETSYVKGDSLTFDMAAGEGVLLVIE